MQMRQFGSAAGQRRPTFRSLQGRGSGLVVRAAMVTAEKATRKPAFPFTKIAGQEDMKLALLLNVVDPNIGGVLIMGDRGTAKSVSVRGSGPPCAPGRLPAAVRSPLARRAGAAERGRLAASGPRRPSAPGSQIASASARAAR